MVQRWSGSAAMRSPFGGSSYSGIGGKGYRAAACAAAAQAVEQPARQVTVMIGPAPGSRPVSDEVCGRKSYATVVADPVEKERVQFEPPDAVVVADAMFNVHTLEVCGLRSNHTVRPASARPASAP